MRPTFHIRLARVEEAAALSDLCFRSKAVWGYDAGFMALMPAALKVAPEDIVAGNVWIATRADGQIAGVVALALGGAPGTLDLSKLFIEPQYMRGGVGRALLEHAVAEARRRGAERLTRSWLTRTQRASMSATARSGSVRRLRTRCPAACYRSTRSGSIPRDDRGLGASPGRQIQASSGPG
jgi:GNAT superfamily N-acetyltransferase